jgi:hypothetical protein
MIANASWLPVAVVANTAGADTNPFAAVIADTNPLAAVVADPDPLAPMVANTDTPFDAVITNANLAVITDANSPFHPMVANLSFDPVIANVNLLAAFIFDHLNGRSRLICIQLTRIDRAGLAGAHSASCGYDADGNARQNYLHRHAHDHHSCSIAPPNADASFDVRRYRFVVSLRTIDRVTGRP